MSLYMGCVGIEGRGIDVDKLDSSGQMSSGTWTLLAERVVVF